MKKISTVIMIMLAAAIYTGCSRDSDEKIRYDMEKLVYMAGKLAEKIDIRPQLATSADSLALKKAYRKIIDYYHEYKDHPLVDGKEKIEKEMSRMAVNAQVQLARYYTVHGNADSVIAAYKRIGDEIPADSSSVAGAGLALALTYRALNRFDSTLAYYDRVLEFLYPPLNDSDQVNRDVISIPIDKIKIARGVKSEQQADDFARDGLRYYDRIQNDFPDHEQLVRQAMVNASRIYTMTEQWDMAIGQLEQIKDSTGRIDVAALVLIANVYNGPKQDIDRAIEYFRDILERQPDSSVIASTMLQLGMALCAQDKHQEGRSVLADLKRDFPQYPQLTAPAQFYYAQSFAADDRWERALSEYQWLMENHPYAEESFWAARRIPEHFANENNDKLADAWYERAIEFYQNAAQVRKGQQTELLAYTYLAEIYRIDEQWDKALETLETIHSVAPGTRLAAKALYNAAAVAYRKKDDSLLARDYLNRLQREFGTTDSTRIYREEKTELNLETLE